ncbi:Protein SABRE, partial [Dipsacomyces acuminosporus]
MRFPVVILIGIALLSVLLPLPRRYLVHGSLVHSTLNVLPIPSYLLVLVLHPAAITPVMYFALLRILHLALSFPVRMFFGRFGLDVRGFSGTSFNGLLLSVRIKNSMELTVRVQEVGFDIRMMRRFRKKIFLVVQRLRNRLRSQRAAPSSANIKAQVHRKEAKAEDTYQKAPPSTPNGSKASFQSAETNTSEHTGRKPKPSNNGRSSSGRSSNGRSRNDGGSNGLSKRLQIYAHGIQVQLLVVPSQISGQPGNNQFWLDAGSGNGITGGAAATTHPGQPETDRHSTPSQHVLDSETRHMAAKLARKISTILRTYAYFASLFARWVDISVSDVSLMVAHSSDMARAGHGVTLHISNVMVWAESARESLSGAHGSGWVPTDIMSSLHGIFEWVLSVFKFKSTNADGDNDSLQQQAQAQGATDQHSPSPESEESSISDSSNTLKLSSLMPQVSTPRHKRDKGLKYLSTLAIDISDIRVFPGIEGAQQHMNSRWELVKMMVMNDMLHSKNQHEGDKPHRRGPVLNCRKCTIKNDVITSFWGLPKKVEQSIEFDQTHVRAGIMEPLLDEITVICLVLSARAYELSSNGSGTLNSRLASILRQYKSSVSSNAAHQASSANVGASAAPAGANADKGAGAQPNTATACDEASKAQEKVNCILFSVHEILSKLRLDHVGIALRVSELVFDLPLSSRNKDVPLIIEEPGMLRWRQKNIAIEGGYLWNSISSGANSTVASASLASEAQGKEPTSGSGDDLDTLGTDFASSSRDTHRSKDSMAFIRVSSGLIQVTALRTPSMTTDLRAEELAADSPGLKLQYCTLYGEMSAFLSEDLTNRPSPKPVFSLDVSQPELTLDLHTQLAIDEAKLWAGHISQQLKEMKAIAQGDREHRRAAGISSNETPNHSLLAVVNLIFADVKFHITVERALYAIRPFVVPGAAEDKADKDKYIALRMRHAECHVGWDLVDSNMQHAAVDSGSDSDSGNSSSDGSSFHSVASSTDSRSAQGSKAQPRFRPRTLDVLTPKVQFKLSTSPIFAGWESLNMHITQQQRQQQQPMAGSDTPNRMLLCVKRGIRASGDVDLCIGHMAGAIDRPRVNANVNAEISDIAGMIREHDFKKWLSMQPLWLVTQILRANSLNYRAAGNPAGGHVSGTSAYSLAPIEERRRLLTATVRVLFDSARVTILACDNEEDVRSGIEHGTQTCFYRGFVDIRANGGSLESPHSFGFRPDAAKITLNLACERASMFLLSAVPKRSARLCSGCKSLPADFEAGDLYGDLPDSVQAHILLVKPCFNFSRQKLEPYRARMIIDLTTTAFNGTTSVSSVYRWSVFMHHIKYWSRRKKLARHMATQFEEPSPPDDLLVTINSELLDLHGDLVLPAFFDHDKNLMQYLQADHTPENPQMKLKMPQVRFTVEKTKDTTDTDLVMSISTPIATLYGSSTPKGQTKRSSLQPLLSFKQCKINFRFPRKAKCEELGADQGVRRNSTYDSIDVAFEKAAIAFGHRYNMAETIDGYILLQKGCKRIAKKSSSTCYPPLQFPESALAQKPTIKMILSTLGNPRTYSPPSLRSMTGAKPPPPPTLAVPDDIPTINFHGSQFSILVHDDPFETALSRIYQVGLREQRERLSRLEAFNAKAKEIRNKREQEFHRLSASSRKVARQATQTSSSVKHRKGTHLHNRRHKKQPNDAKGMKGSSTLSGVFHAHAGSVHKRSGFVRPQTFTPMQSTSHAASSSSLGGVDSSNNLQSIASASVQDLPSYSRSATHGPRGRANIGAIGDASRSRVSIVHDGTASGYAESVNSAYSSNDGDHNDADDGSDDGYCDDPDSHTQHSDPYQRMLDEASAEIDAAYQRLMAVESREWVKAIRQKMMPPADGCADAASASGELHFEDIFDMPAEVPAPNAEQECGLPHTRIPYNYVSGSWTHPSVPLACLVMSPVWISVDTPLSLLEFSQIESYLRYLDPTTPHNLKWSTLVPTRMRIKCGDIHMQLRDFPFPLFSVPNPYNTDTLHATPNAASSYEDFCGGVEVSGSLIVAERIALDRSLRSVYIPVGPRPRDSDVDLPDVGWHVSKSLQFPRIYTALSILMFSAPPEDNSDARKLQQKYMQSRLPSLPVMSTWGASYQPVVSALMQRMESLTSKSADVSPALAWWDKVRSRMHVKCRMTVINAPSKDASALSIDGQGHHHASGSKDKARRKLESEEGQMFFLALDGRDPYQVIQKTGGYLFAMRGGVRICINEGYPGKGLWDEHSGKGIYSTPSEDSVPLPATLGEFLTLRCEEFLMGVPIIVDRQSAILKAIDLAQGIRESVPGEPNAGMGGVAASTRLDGMETGNMLPQLGHAPPLPGSPPESRLPGVAYSARHSSQGDPQSWRKAHMDLLYNIINANSARYTFASHSVDRLYHKVLLHLSGGVRLGIGLSSYIPPDQAGFRHNHWEVQPIAPESAANMAAHGITDAFVGYRSSKLHTGVSLRCPFIETGSPIQGSFPALYLSTSKSAVDNKAHGAERRARTRKGKSVSPVHTVRYAKAFPHLRLPDTHVLAKTPRLWTPSDIDALVSPLHRLFSNAEYEKASSEHQSVRRGNDASNHRLGTHDLFFTPFPLPKEKGGASAEMPAPGTADAQQHPHHGVKRASSKPQCQINISSAAIYGVHQYLLLYVSRMMLPIRKGTLYPFTETSNNKLGNTMRSLRLLLDLKNVELVYSQRDFEIKELESKEVVRLGFDEAELSSQRPQSPALSDSSSLPNQTLSGAKAEGTVRELKARVDLFSFNLLLEQTQVKLKVGSQSAPEPSISPAASAPTSRKSARAPESMSAKAKTHGGEPKRAPSKASAETQALRWGVGDASTEIDYLDVRLVQMSFIMPLFMNSLSAEYADECKRLNGLRFAEGECKDLTAFEQSWISPISIRDLNELDLSEALFSSPKVVSVLWSPRMVYFTQRPEWTQFSDTVDDILASSAAGNGSPKTPMEGVKPPAAKSSDATPTSPEPGALEPLKSPVRDGLLSLDSSVASMSMPREANMSLLQRSMSASKQQAASDSKHFGHSARHSPKTLALSASDDADIPAKHKRNASMTWGLSRHMSQENPAADGLFTKPSITHLYYPGSFQPPTIIQRAFSQPNAEEQLGAAETPGNAPQSPGTPQLGESTGEAKSPTAAISYKSSFHLLELARLRQRRLTTSSSRQALNVPATPQKSPEGALQSIGIDQAASYSQASRMIPTGPDPNVIIRDSRSTQAILLKKRKQMLGIAIQHEQASLAYLSHQFERAPTKHNEEFRKAMVRRAEHIYELGARRKLINRCLRFLGVDPDAEDSGVQPGVSALPQGDVDFDKATQEVEKVLASLYRHRCLIYSGYLIWTSQVRDILMRFLYIQDCLNAINYYMSETATKVARNATSGKETGSSDGVPDLCDLETRCNEQTGDMPCKPTADEAISSPAHDAPAASAPRSRPKSSDQRSTASDSSRRTRHFPNLLRKLRSHGHTGARAHKGSEKQSGKRQKPKEVVRQKEGYKPPKRRVASNKFEKQLKSVWDDFSRYHPYYSFLVEFLNSQVSMRVDEETSTSSLIAVAERVQLHRILLCNGNDFMLGDASNDQDHGAGQISPPNDESIIKTRNLVEIENVQVFTAKRDDFENKAAYFVDCTYGSQFEGDASQSGTIWPAWVPIELLLSQGKHKARGIFDEEGELDDGNDDNDAYSDSDGSVSSAFTFASDGEGQKAQEKRRKSKYGRAWWVQDLSKYTRLMDRNNCLLVYDKANPHRIQSDNTGSIDMPVVEGETENKDGVDADDGHVTRAATAASGFASAAAGHVHSSFDGIGTDSQGRSDDVAPGKNNADGSSTGAVADDDSIDSADEESGTSQSLSHRANHIAVFLPEMDLACTAEQYVTVYETVTDLLVYSDSEKAAYMDHLNTILLSIDVEELRGLLAVIRATKDALRERLPIIQDWYTIQRSEMTRFSDLRPAVALSGRSPLSSIDFNRQKSNAISLLTLDRHRRALELQLRTAMDLFGAAQKQKKQQQKHGRRDTLASLDVPGAGSGHLKGKSAEISSIRRPSDVSMADMSVVSQGADRRTLTSHHTRMSGFAKEQTSDRMSFDKKLDSTARSAALSSRAYSTQTTDETQSTIARTINLFISKATWHMLENDGQPLCDVTLRWASLKAVTRSDQATQLLSEVHLLYVVNKLPNPMFTDLVGPYVRPKHPKPDFCIDKMIRVRWSELAPVGGISIVESFEVSLFPLRLQLSHDIAQKLINYLYPPQESSGQGPNSNASLAASRADLASPTSNRQRRPADSNTKPDDARDPANAHLSMATLSEDKQPPPGLQKSATFSTASSGHTKSLFATKMRKAYEDQVKDGVGDRDEGDQADSLPNADGSRLGTPSASSTALASMSNRGSPHSFLSESTSVISIPQSGENRDQVDQMKKRASSNKTFLNIKIDGSTICISYQGKKASNITDLRDFEFHAPTLELRNKVESYFELLMQVKKEYMSVVVQHTGALVKEKFRQLHHRKAWSKTSFGPDWEARKLLIEMDRQVEMGMMETIQHSVDLRDQSLPAAPSHLHAAAIPSSADSKTVGDIANMPAEMRPQASSGQQSSASMISTQHGRDEPTDGEDAASLHSLALPSSATSATSAHGAPGKAPLSKYMILDPRKLMGKRLPSMLPRNFSRTDPSRASTFSPDKSHWDERGGSSVGSMDSKHLPKSERPFGHSPSLSGRPSPLLQPPYSGSIGFRGLYSPMYLDMVPASAASVRSEPFRNSPTSPKPAKGLSPRQVPSRSTSPPTSPFLPSRLVPIASPSPSYKSDDNIARKAESQRARSPKQRRN